MRTDHAKGIREIEAEDVLGEFDYVVPFEGDSDADRMRIIYAPNGRGKTNFLRAVNLLLAPSPESFSALIEIPVRLMRITFISGGFIQLVRKQVSGSFAVSASLGADSEPAALTVDPSDINARFLRRVWDERDDFTKYVEVVNELSSGAVFIGDDRLLLPSEDQARPDARRRSAGSVSRLLEAVERMLTQAALASLSRESAQTGVYGEITRTTLEGRERSYSYGCENRARATDCPPAGRRHLARDVRTTFDATGSGHLGPAGRRPGEQRADPRSAPGAQALF